MNATLTPRTRAEGSASDEAAVMTDRVLVAVGWAEAVTIGRADSA